MAVDSFYLKNNFVLLEHISSKHLLWDKMAISVQSHVNHVTDKIIFNWHRMCCMYTSRPVRHAYSSDMITCLLYHAKSLKTYYIQILYEYAWIFHHVHTKTHTHSNVEALWEKCSYVKSLLAGKNFVNFAL